MGLRADCEHEKAAHWRCLSRHRTEIDGEGGGGEGVVTERGGAHATVARMSQHQRGGVRLTGPDLLIVKPNRQLAPLLPAGVAVEWGVGDMPLRTDPGLKNVQSLFENQSIPTRRVGSVGGTWHRDQNGSKPFLDYLNGVLAHSGTGWATFGQPWQPSEEGFPNQNKKP